MPKLLVAVQEISVSPTGNVVNPNNGHETETVPLDTVAVAGLQLTTPVCAFKVVKATRFGEQLMTGGVVSATSTLKEQEAILLAASRAMHVTSVLP